MAEIVVAGSTQAADTAARILSAGGNAFDAAVGAAFAACVCEPAHASLGGCGFLLAAPRSAPPRVYDGGPALPHARFRVQPQLKDAEIDYGPRREPYRYGAASLAVPGLVRALFAAQRDLGRMPLQEITQPAIALAKRCLLDKAQEIFLEAAAPVFLASAATRAIFASALDAPTLHTPAEPLVQMQLADTLEAVAHEGERLFYEGEIASLIENECAAQGGLLTRADFKAYRCELRAPLQHVYKGTRLLTNPPPAFGGLLLAATLALLEDAPLAGIAIDAPRRLAALARALRTADELVSDAADRGTCDERVLSHPALSSSRREIALRAKSLAGSTHISVIDAEGQAASLSLSNGQGSGHLVAGFMLNNLFDPTSGAPGIPCERLATPLAPSLFYPDRDTCIALGAGGATRIAGAMMQALVNIKDGGLDLEPAIRAPRVHCEHGELDIEHTLVESTQDVLLATCVEARFWSRTSPYFGGVNAAAARGNLRRGFADTRYGGSVAGSFR